jgi:arginyl-tRNA synthetase
MPDDADPITWGEQRAIADISEVLEKLNVRFDTWFSERSLVESGAVEATLGDLKDKGVVFEDGGATWLRSTDYGDDKDRVLVKSDGDATYLLPDVAYHRDKIARGAEKLIDVWGADHPGYVARMRAAIQSLGYDPEMFEVPIVQLVKLERGGKEVRLSKRTGELVELREVIDEVGPDAARLTFLLQSVDTKQTFDLEVVASQAMENPVFYVQMAHARIAGIARVAGEHGVERLPLGATDLALLTHERELEVLRKLSELPETLAVALADRAPHKITTWVRELADRFHGFYHDCYVIHPDVSAELAQARLWLVESARVGLAIGLDLLGVTAPESM